MTSIAEIDSKNAVLDAYDKSNNTDVAEVKLTSAMINDAAKQLGMDSLKAKDLNALSLLGASVEKEGVVKMGLGMVLLSTNTQIKILSKIEKKLDDDEFDEEPDQLLAAAKVAGDLGKNIAANGKTLVDVAKEGLVKEKKEGPKKATIPPPGFAFQVNGDVHLGVKDKGGDQ